MAWYRTGTVTVTSGSSTVTGVGTKWVSKAYVGDGFLGPDGKLYEVQNLASDTELQLATEYLGDSASDASYVLAPTQSIVRSLAAQVGDLVTLYTNIPEAVTGDIEAAQEAATTATTKAGEAATSASTATTKASEASTSASTASTAAGTATTKASEAATSASSASGSASTASTYAGTATTKASEASTSASSAATSASAAASSASAAANSAATQVTLTDATADSTLPATTASSVSGLLQTTRNALKWLVARFNTAGAALTAVALATARTFQVNLASTSTASFDGSANVTPGVTGTLPIANGGTGNTTGLAATATTLATARTIQTNLASTSSASFNGSANVTPGVTGALPVANGGTGSTTAATALTALGAAALASPTFTGTPAAPTATQGTATTQLATTAFVDAERDRPVVTVSSATTLAATHRNRTLYASAGITVPANATVALPIGFTCTVICATSSLTLTQATNVELYWAGQSGTTGNRTLAITGTATLIKMGTNAWIVSGFGMT